MHKAAIGPLEMQSTATGVVVEIQGDWALCVIKTLDDLLHSDDMKERKAGVDLLLRTNKGLVEGEIKKHLGITKPTAIAAIATASVPMEKQQRLDRMRQKKLGV